MNHVRCKPAGQRTIRSTSLSKACLKPESAALLLVVTDRVGAAHVSLQQHVLRLAGRYRSQ